MNLLQLEKQKNVLTQAHYDFEKSLCSYATFKVNSAAIGEDLVQDTFKKTWKYLLEGGQIHAMKPFLYRILNNLIIDEYRKRKHRTSSLDTLIENGFEPPDDSSDRIFDILDGKALALLIHQLPKTYQSVMHMRHIENMSLGEIANKTRKTRNTITVQIHRGLKKLKTLQG